MLEIREIPVPGYEKVIEAINPEVGLHCFIAIYNTSLGPALGGVRIYLYKSREDALEDVLRLAKGMTYKSALCEDGLGGGKAVIIAHPKDKTDKLLLAFAEVVDSLHGHYIAAEDVGTNEDDMETIKKGTPYVAALPSEKSSGDPSRFTAWGIFKGIQAVATTLWKSTSLESKKITVQGLGQVGSKLAEILFWEGADLILCDIDSKKAHELALLYRARVVTPDELLVLPCDIYSPCSLGGVINDKTISQLHCLAIAGSANNQLLDPRHGQELHDKNILYAPDYIINSGGIINAASEFNPEGYNPKYARERVKEIYTILLSIFEESRQQNKPTSQIADELAEYKLKHLIGKRQTPIRFLDSPRCDLES